MGDGAYPNNECNFGATAAKNGFARIINWPRCLRGVRLEWYSPLPTDGEYGSGLKLFQPLLFCWYVDGVRKRGRAMRATL